MIGDPAGLGAIAEARELAKVVAVQRIRRADRQRYPVHHDRIAGGDRIQDLQGPPAGLEEVLADDLEPIDRRGGVQDVTIVRGPKPEPNA